MLLHIIVTVTLSLSYMTCFASHAPANFVFGDSLVDVGNNNYLDSLAKADTAPNGVDFGAGPTGRFTNGRTVVDIIGQELGAEGFAPPFLDPATTGDLILRGVNYASGGSGILNHTGYIFVGRINMDAQIDNFASTKEDIISMIGEIAAKELLSKALFSITMGSNDFLSNYLVPLLSKPEQALIPPHQYVQIVMVEFKRQLTRLYDLGARKIIVVSMGPIGCIPFTREINPSTKEGCVSFPNQLAKLFNSNLKVVVDELSNSLIGSKFVFTNTYQIVDDIIQNYASYGFKNADFACCYVAGRFGGLIPCATGSKFCPNRSENIFWDPYHPSEATNLIIAKRFLDGDLNDISPKNIRQLVEES